MDRVGGCSQAHQLPLFLSCWGGGGQQKRKMEGKGRGTVRDVREGERTHRRDGVVTGRSVCVGGAGQEGYGWYQGWGGGAQAAPRSVIQQFSDRDTPGWAAGRQRGPVGWGRGLAPKAMKY